MNDKIPLIVILGPTAVGKTAVAIQVAKQVDGEIISSDSRLFYRGMDIGTAKPTSIEMDGIRHHMIDIADPDEVVSLGTFRQMVGHLVKEIHARGHIPMLVGGTGQYIRAVTQGWDVPEIAPNLKLRTELENLLSSDGIHEASRWLEKLDPVTYNRIDHQNPRRLIRALEVILTSGKPFSEQRIKSEVPFHLLQIGLTRPRAEIYQRVDDRIDQMVKDGWVEEVQGLLRRGYTASLPAMSAIGYNELIHYLSGEIPLTQAVQIIKQRTHAFVRRQANWFKPSDPEIEWFTVDGHEISNIIDRVNSWLGR